MLSEARWIGVPRAIHPRISFRRTSDFRKKEVMNRLPLRFLFALLALTFAVTPVFAAGPAVSIYVSQSMVTDQGEDVYFTIVASSPATRRTAINFVLGGTAVPGRDYTLVGDLSHGKIFLGPGSSVAVVQLHTFDTDGPAQASAGITLIGGQKYHLGSPRSAFVQIENVR